MSDPQGDQRYGQLVQQIGIGLLNVAPPGWRRLDLVAKVSVAAQDYDLGVLMPDNSQVVAEVPEDAIAAILELRRLMFQPERGTWFSMRFMMDPPTAYHAFYNFDHDPQWDPPLPPEVFRRDLEAFPRPADAVPAWLRGLVAQAPTPSQPQAQ
jgi:hypothetical protein